MSRHPSTRWAPGDLIVPTIPDLAGITPAYCCRCGYTLAAGHAEYREGPVCRACDAVIQRSLSTLPNDDQDGEGGGM